MTIKNKNSRFMTYTNKIHQLVP